MSPRINHKKPVIAFIVLVVVAAAVVGNGLRAGAESLHLLTAGRIALHTSPVHGSLLGGIAVPSRSETPVKKAASSAPARLAPMAQVVATAAATATQVPTTHVVRHHVRKKAPSSPAATARTGSHTRSEETHTTTKPAGAVTGMATAPLSAVVVALDSHRDHHRTRVIVPGWGQAKSPKTSPGPSRGERGERRGLAHLFGHAHSSVGGWSQGREPDYLHEAGHGHGHRSGSGLGWFHPGGGQHSTHGESHGHSDHSSHGHSHDGSRGHRHR